MDNGGKLIAGSDSIAGAWEAFNIEKVGDTTTNDKIEKWDGSSSVTYNTVKLSNGKYSIKSVANEKYVVAENGGSDPIVANRDSYGVHGKHFI